MSFLIKRYVIDFIILAVITLGCWIASIWYLDGIIPWVVGLLFVSFLITYIPYMIHLDYQKVRNIWMDYQKMKSNEITKETFQKNVLTKIAEEVGVPELIAEKILQKIIKEKEVPIL